MGFSSSWHKLHAICRRKTYSLSSKWSISGLFQYGSICFSRCFNPTSSLTHIMDGEKETQQHTQRYMHNGIHFPFFSKSFGSHYYRPYNALQNSLRTSHLPIYYSSTFCYRHISASSGMKASHVIRCQCSKRQGFRVMECGWHQPDLTNPLRTQ